MTITGAGISSSHPSAIKNPKHEEHASMLVWISGAFDPEGFDLNEIGRTLRIGPQIGTDRFLDVRYSTLVEIADDADWSNKTYNNAISVLRRAFKFGYCDYPEKYSPTFRLKSARISKKDRIKIDPFNIQDAEALIAAIHRNWGEAQGNYDEFRFFTGMRPSEQIALVVSDFDKRSSTG